MTINAIITKLGTTRKLEALLNNTPITIDTIKFSSTIMTITGDETTMPSIVHTVSGAGVKKQIIGTNTAILNVLLDETVGTWTIGTMGVYTSAGDLFALVNFPGGGSKVASVPPLSLGNVKKFYFSMQDDNFNTAVNIAIGTTFTGVLLEDGSVPMQAAFNFNGFKGIALSPGTVATDAINKSQLDAHTARVDNPHSVTPAQLSVYTKAESDTTNATQNSNLTSHTVRVDNPHVVTAAQVGAYTTSAADAAIAAAISSSLGSVTNYLTTAASTGTSAYVIGSLAPSGFALSIGRRVVFPIGATNTSTTNTLNANATGAKNIVKQTAAGLVALAVGDLVIGGVGDVIYNGTSWVLMQTPPAQIPQGTIASAATTDIGTIASRNVLITGVATITSLGSTAILGFPLYTITFSGILTLTHASNLLLPGSVNIITAAGDTCSAHYLGSGNWAVKDYRRITGKALIESLQVPAMPGNAGRWLTNNGTIASWDDKALSASATFVGSTGAIVGTARNITVVRNSNATYTISFTNNLNSGFHLMVYCECVSFLVFPKAQNRTAAGFQLFTILSNNVPQEPDFINILIFGGL